MNNLAKEQYKFEKQIEFDRKWHLEGTIFQRFDRKKYNKYMARLQEIEKLEEEKKAAELKAIMNAKQAEINARRAEEAAALLSYQEHDLIGKKFRKGEIHVLNLNENNTNSNASNNEQMARSQFKNIYKRSFCDSEGFYQHSGECWNDSIQMMFLFSDGLKEIVQKKLANAVFLDDIHTLDDTFISDSAINNIVINYNIIYEKEGYIAVPEHIKNELTLYFKTVQHRFIRHYLVEYNRRALLENESCPVKRPAQRLHVRGRNGILSAIHGKGSGTIFSKKNYSIMKSHGGTYADMGMLIVVYINTFFNPSDFNFKLIRTISNTEFIEIIKDINIFNNLRCVSLISASPDKAHAMCLYTCGGNDFFYEDNFGPFLFPWKSILSNKTDFTFVGLTTGTLGTGNNNIMISVKSAIYPIIISKKGDEENKYYTYYNNKLYSIIQNVLTLLDRDDSLSFGSKETYIKYENDIYLTRLYIPVVYTPISAIEIENTSFEFNRGMRLQRNGPVLGGKRNKKTRNKRVGRNITRKNA
jgi:hypothetical protein